MTAPGSSARHHQQLAAAVLASLLALPAPECWSWEINTDGSIRGHLRARGSLDQARIALHQWAAVLDSPAWKYEPYLTAPGHAHLSIAGTYQGHRVEVWDGVETIPGLTVEELATPPLADAAAGGDAR